MASIPLSCNICPNEPDFSDVSHLLTHVASKGHLFHYFRAQVSAVQDETIRQKLNAFDRWYDKYQIARLLSQRISSKESKKHSKSKTPIEDPKRAKPAKPTKPRGRRYNVCAERSSSPSPVKIEDRIDPQLATNGQSSRHYTNLQESPSQEAALRHRAHIPRMLNWQKESPSIHRRSSSLPPHQKSPIGTLRSYDSSVHDVENSCFCTFARSPVRSEYPELPNFPSLLPQLAGSNVKSDNEKDLHSPSPVLKGVKYPGMSLFDSASQEAQRLRNQKKDGSVLEQMVLDSASIEPMEHIYWPGGGLKKCRVITGNVESSSIEAPTPPPKHKRTRRKPLADLSTNATKLGRKRGRKPGKAKDPKEPGLRHMAGDVLDTLKTVYPENAHIDYDPLGDRSHKKHVATVNPAHGRKASFFVFRDPSEERPRASTILRPSTTHSTRSVLSPKAHARNFFQPSAEIQHTKQPISTEPDNDTRGQTYHQNFDLHMMSLSPLQSSVLKENKENDGPSTILSSNAVYGKTNDDEPERITQRYFSVVGDQPPQFFSTMPPQMGFGGTGGSGFFGTTLNPLNPFLSRYYQQPQFSPALFVQRDAPTSPGQTITRSGSSFGK